ncbi:spore gernimation protein [Bacillus thuringiensis]|nr:spore gernimation protein [Bacillus thuringiensis]MBG9504231.1 spore gernimation protein [Bacillus thuringiensis]
MGEFVKAIVRLLKLMGQTISIVGGYIIGELVVNAGIINLLLYGPHRSD